MALSAAQLADMVVKAKLYMGIGDDDWPYLADGIAVFCDSSDATSATVQVTDTTIVLDIVGGVDDATTTLTLADADKDTLAELVTAINAVDGWTANLIGKSDATSTLLVRLAETGCLGQANEQVLLYENEEKLELLITDTFDAIETYLDREIISANYTDLVDCPTSCRWLLLKHPDVTAVSQVQTEAVSGLRVKYSGSDTNARVEVTNTAVILTSVAGATTTSTSTAFTAQATTALMATAIAAVSGWTATVIETFPSELLIRRGAQDAKDREVTLSVWADSEIEYEVDYEAGMIDFSNSLARTFETGNKARVVYTAGFSSVPADMELVLLELVKDQWDGTKRDASLKSERLGDYAYAIGEMDKAIDFNGHASVLDKYRRFRP